MATNPITLTNGTIAYASDVETKVNPLYTDITNANISASAAISYTKMDGTTSISLSSTASFSQSGSGTAVFSSTATDPFRFHGSGDSYSGSKILRLTCDNVAGGGFTFLQAIADYNGTPSILIDISDRGAILNGVGMNSITTASGVSTYTLSGVTTSATTCAIGIVGAQTSNAVVSQLDFYNASSGSADKRLVSIKANRSGADNTGSISVLLASTGTLASVVDITNTQFQIASGLDFSVGAAKKVYFDNFGDTYIYQESDNKLNVVVGGTARLVVNSTSYVEVVSVPLVLTAGQKLYFDGLNDTSIYQVSDNKIVVETGGSSAISFDASLITIETGRTLLIAANSTTQKIINVTGDSLTSGWLGYFYSNSSSSTARNLVEIVNDNTSATSAVCLKIQQDGASPGVTIQTTSGRGISITNTSQSLASLAIEGDRNAASDTEDIFFNAENSGSGSHSAMLFGSTAEYDYFISIQGTHAFYDPSATSVSTITAVIKVGNGSGSTVGYIPLYNTYA